ncbi:MAG TPA: ElyC/SanA/YdcF family protein [Candidatus Edwardsbacteria bacterium]|nr:ElyC/SanA/YdcF family protein [Candidatus Edwardsbacteria bacterium]
MSAFIVKRLVGDLLAPLPLAFLAALAGLALVRLGRAKALGRALLGLGLLLLLALSYGLGTDRALRSLEYRYPPLPDASGHRGVRWVVVLGGGLVSDPRLPLTGQLSEGSQIRVIEGIRVYRQLKGAKLLLSGGPVFNTVPEARAMAGLAESLGVPSQDIALDTVSMDTEAQARFAKAALHGDSLVLVTSAYHMPRSMALFAGAGLACIPAPTNYLDKRHQGFDPDRLFPNSGGIRRAEAVVHEYLGLAWSRLRKRT